MTVLNHYAEFHIECIVMPNAIMLSVVMLNATNAECRSAGKMPS
jgi:hypothetical protein